MGQGSAELAKTYDPEQPRDWRGRFGEGSGAKAKPKSSGVQTADASANALLPMIGLGLLGAAIIGHTASNSARKKPENGSQTPVSPSTSDEPEKDGKPDREPRFRGDNLGPELDKPGALPPNDPDKPPPAPVIPPGSGGATQRPAVPETIHPTDAELQPLVDEHKPDQGLPLTMAAARTIIDATQPAGTKAIIVGKDVPGPDIIYEDANGARVTTVQVKTAKNLDRAEDAARYAVSDKYSGDLVALQVPSDTDIPRLMGKLRGLNSMNTNGRFILIVDPNGKLLVKSQPF